MQYFITGATGFIGRFLVAELLKHPDAQIHALVRKGSEHKLDTLRKQLGASATRLSAVSGDLAQARLGLTDDDIHRLQGRIDHFFHLAALYDLKANAAPQITANIDGTRHALDAAAALGAGCFQHVSSIAAGGLYPGRFSETMFEEAVGLEDPYFFTKHESERLVREETRIPWRIYRPSLVVGDSKSGFIDKIDGPYYLFPIMQQLQKWLPAWLPLPGLVGGQFNIVPVDYVAQAMDHIAHTEGLDQTCFHLTSDRDYTLAELFNLLAKVSGAPGFRFAVDNNAMTERQKQWAAKIFNAAPVHTALEKTLNLLGMPPSTLVFLTFPATYDRRNTIAALKDSGIAPRAFEDYLPILWAYWREHLANRTH